MSCFRSLDYRVRPGKIISHLVRHHDKLCRTESMFARAVNFNPNFYNSLVFCCPNCIIIMKRYAVDFLSTHRKCKFLHILLGTSFPIFKMVIPEMELCLC